MIPITRRRADPTRIVSPGLTPSRSATAGAIAISRPLGRSDSAPDASCKRPTSGHAASAARRSTTVAGPPASAIARIAIVSDTRPAAANAASSSTVARRCDTRNSTSPPRICRPFASSAATMLAARLPIPASAAVPRKRQATSSSNPRPPRRRSRHASRQTMLKRGPDRRRPDRPRDRSRAHTAPPARDRA